MNIELIRTLCKMEPRIATPFLLHFLDIQLFFTRSDTPVTD